MSFNNNALCQTSAVASARKGKLNKNDNIDRHKDCNDVINVSVVTWLAVVGDHNATYCIASLERHKKSMRATRQLDTEQFCGKEGGRELDWLTAQMRPHYPCFVVGRRRVFVRRVTSCAWASSVRQPGQPACSLRSVWGGHSKSSGNNSKKFNESRHVNACQKYIILKKSINNYKILITYLSFHMKNKYMYSVILSCFCNIPSVKFVVATIYVVYDVCSTQDKRWLTIVIKPTKKKNTTHNTQLERRSTKKGDNQWQKGHLTLRKASR